MAKSNGSFTANTQDSDVIVTRSGELPMVMIRGTWVGTITLRVSEDDGVSWYDYESYTANEAKSINVSSPGWQFKLSTTAWTSGTAYWGLG